MFVTVWFTNAKIEVPNFLTPIIEILRLYSVEMQLREWGYIAKTSWLFSPQSGYFGCRQTVDWEGYFGMEN